MKIQLFGVIETFMFFLVLALSGRLNCLSGKQNIFTHCVFLVLALSGGLKSLSGKQKHFSFRVVFWS